MATIMLGPPDRGGTVPDVLELCLMEMFDFPEKVDLSLLEIQQLSIMTNLGKFVSAQRRGLDDFENFMMKRLEEHFEFVMRVATKLTTVGPAFSSSTGGSSKRTREPSTDESDIELGQCVNTEVPPHAKRMHPSTELRSSEVRCPADGAASSFNFLTCMSRTMTSGSSASDMSFRRKLASLDNIAPWQRHEYTSSSPLLSPTVRRSRPSDRERFEEGSDSAGTLMTATQQLQEAYTRYSSRVSNRNSSNSEFAKSNSPVAALATFSTATVAKRNAYEVFILLVILVDAIFVALVTEYFISNSTHVYDRRSQGVEASLETPAWDVPMEIAVNTFFLLELTMRVFALKGAFFKGAGWRWNLFDAVVLVGSVTEMAVISQQSRYSSNGAVRVLRISRILRTVRMLRLVRYTPMFAGLQLMLIALANSAVALLWAVVMLGFVLILFALIFVNAAATYLATVAGVEPDAEIVREYFCSLPMTLLTLFMSMTGGIDWWVGAKAMLSIHPAYAVLFVLFVLLMVVVVLNVITGIFVNDAVAFARMDEDMRMQAELQESRQLTDRLNSMFRDIDTSSNGSFTLEDLKAQLQRHEVNMLFSLLGIDVSDAVSFFNLLDVDGSGSVQIEEFVMGCLRLQGRSGMMNMEINIQETGRIVRVGNTLLKSLCKQSNRIEQILEQLAKSSVPRGMSSLRASQRSMTVATSDSLKLELQSPVASSSHHSTAASH